MLVIKQQASWTYLFSVLPIWTSMLAATDYQDTHVSD
jgi:hypothetical protein